MGHRQRALNVGTAPQRSAAQRSAAQGLLTDGTDATTSSSSSSPAAASTGFGALKAIA